MSKMKRAKSISRPKIDNSRKAMRKQKRQQKKVHRQEHYLKKKSDVEKPTYAAGRFVKRPADADEPEKEVKKKKLKLQPTAQDILSRQRAKEMKETNKLKSEMEEQRRQILLKANEEEDRLIKKLEKQMGLKKSKNKNNYFADDGLDYLLEICDKKTTEQIVAAEKHLAEVEGDSDFEQDLAVVTGKELSKDTKAKEKKSKQKDDSEDSDFDDNVGSEHEDSENDFDDEDLGDDLSEDDDGEISNENDAAAESDSDAPDEKPTFSKKSSKSKELKLEKENKSTLNNKLKSEKSKLSKESKPIKESKSVKERIVKADDLSKIFSDDEISHLSGDDDLEGFSGDESENDEANQELVERKQEKPDVWEDIYGRKRDKEGNIIKEDKGVYVPPHLRNQGTEDDKQMQQLKRQIKSILNKLAGTNLHWACGSTEALYACNSRHAVNCALTAQWLAAAAGPAHAPPRLLAEHAALIAVLHANVGSEIGAHFLQELCKQFDEMTQRPQPMEDKRLDNLVSCLAHLYSFKIFHASLLYDILNRLISSVSEKSIECVVSVLRVAGAGARREEPALLRRFVADAQAQAQAVGGADSGSRVKFLLEVLMAVKNNNLTKIPNYDPSYQEELRKLTRTIVRKGNYITPLNIRLDDLLKADERGKWWVVGSAWEGGATRADEPAAAPAQPARDQKLLELARKQRMNTDVRRSIFCVIMAAEDYMDAFEKLQHLGLRGQQEREVVHVMLACCLQEKTFNPYYALLGQKLCDFDRKYQLSIQYSIWDKIKDIENQSKLSLANLAQFLIHLIMQKGLPLSVLKIIQFSELNKHSVRFMRQILLSIIMSEDLATALEVFHRIAKSPKLHTFRESLKLFIQHFLVKNAGKKSNVLSESEMSVLRERADEVKKILSMHESKLRF